VHEYFQYKSREWFAGYQTYANLFNCNRCNWIRARETVLEMCAQYNLIDSSLNMTSGAQKDLEHFMKNIALMNYHRSGSLHLSMLLAKAYRPTCGLSPSRRVRRFSNQIKI
jgi:hypothetical protein